MIAEILIYQSDNQVDNYIKKRGWQKNLAEELSAGQGRMKVADLREWMKKSFLKRKAGEVAVFLIRGADNLSQECQNTLLKPLEEPEEGVVFLLTVKSVNKLLPTIVSRCLKIDLREEKKKDVNQDRWQKLTKVWQGELADCVDLIEELNKEDDVGTFLEEVMTKMEDGLRNWPNKTRVTMTKTALECYRGWQMKVNKKLVLGKLILQGWASINLD